MVIQKGVHAVSVATHTMVGYNSATKLQLCGNNKYCARHNMGGCLAVKTEPLIGGNSEVDRTKLSYST